MNERRGYGAPRGGKGHSPGRGGSGRNGGRRGGPSSSRKSSLGSLPPVWAREELEPLFGGSAMLPPLPAEPNTGLVYDRFLRVWETNIRLNTERFQSLKSFTDAYAGLKQIHSPLLNSMHERLEAATQEGQGESLIAKTQARFVSGLGASHPLENGFCFDYTLGVPHLPGSAVKGLCRQMAELRGEKNTVRTLFGEVNEETESENRKANVGDIIFFPAYPQGWPKLDIDVINSHHQEYYAQNPFVLREDNQDPKSIGPHEIEDPVPVFFLTVPQGTNFVFRCTSRSMNRTNVAQALGLLKQGLAELGIGAKTALGYGIMESTTST